MVTTQFTDMDNWINSLKIKKGDKDKGKLLLWEIVDVYVKTKLNG